MTMSEPADAAWLLVLGRIKHHGPETPLNRAWTKMYAQLSIIFARDTLSYETIVSKQSQYISYVAPLVKE
jgi:hypothetical protein